MVFGSYNIAICKQSESGDRCTAEMGRFCAEELKLVNHWSRRRMCNFFMPAAYSRTSSTSVMQSRMPPFTWWCARACFRVAVGQRIATARLVPILHVNTQDETREAQVSVAHR